MPFALSLNTYQEDFKGMQGTMYAYDKHDMQNKSEIFSS